MPTAPSCWRSRRRAGRRSGRACRPGRRSGSASNGSGLAKAKWEKAPCSRVTARTGEGRAGGQPGEGERHQPGAEAVPDEVHAHARAAAGRAAGRGRCGRPCPRGSSSASRSPGAAPPSPRAAARPTASPNPATPPPASPSVTPLATSASRYRSNSAVWSSSEHPRLAGAQVRTGLVALAVVRDPVRGEPGELAELTVELRRAPRRAAGPCQQGRHRVQRRRRPPGTARAGPASVACVEGADRPRQPRRHRRCERGRRPRRRPPPSAAKSGIGSSDQRCDGQTTPASPTVPRGRLRDLAGPSSAEEAGVELRRDAAVVVPAVREDDHVGDAAGRDLGEERVALRRRPGRPASSKVNSQNGNPAISAVMRAPLRSRSDGLQGAHEVEQAAFPGNRALRPERRSRSRRRSA